MDRFLDYALWLTANDLGDDWIAEVAAGRLQPSPRSMEFVLKAVEPAKSSVLLAKWLADHPLTADGQGPWIELIGQAGQSAELRMLFDKAVGGGFDAAATVRALMALGEATRLRGVKPGEDLHALGKLFDEPNEFVRAAAVRLAGRWRVRELANHLRALAGEPRQPPSVRIAAIDSLRDLRGPETIRVLTAIADGAKESSELRQRRGRDAAGDQSRRRHATGPRTARRSHDGAGSDRTLASGVEPGPGRGSRWRWPCATSRCRSRPPPSVSKPLAPPTFTRIC